MLVSWFFIYLSLVFSTTYASDASSHALEQLHNDPLNHTISHLAPINGTNEQALGTSTNHSFPSENALALNQPDLPSQPNAFNHSTLEGAESPNHVSSISTSTNVSSHDDSDQGRENQAESKLIPENELKQESTLQHLQSSEQIPSSSQNAFESKNEAEALDLSARVANVSHLLLANEMLEKEIISHSAKREVVTESLRDAIDRKNELLKERQSAIETREKLENHIREVQGQMPRYAKTIEVLKKQANEAKQNIERLQNQNFWVTHQKKRLVKAIRERGLEHWVEKSVKDSVSPFLSDALVQGTASVVEPMLDGIEKLAAANGELSKRMSQKLRDKVPIVEKPFYAGFVTYIVLLFPTVLVISLVLKVKRGFSKLSVGHFVILGNFYFLLLSGGCFVATVLGSVDVLVTFRHHNLQMYDFVLVLHGLLFSTHVCAHARVAIQHRDKSALMHMFLLSIIGLHFYVHSYRHAMYNEDPHVEKGAYLLYTSIFVFVLYEITVKQIQRSHEKNRMTLNNKSISASMNKVEAEASAFTSTRDKAISSTRISFLNRHKHSRSQSMSAPGLRLEEHSLSLNERVPRTSCSITSSAPSSRRSPRHDLTDIAAARDL